MTWFTAAKSAAGSYTTPRTGTPGATSTSPNSGKDQITAEAEHAILSSLKFPADARQLHVQDGVIIANPARVLALVQMLRRHIVQIHTLRLSNIERDCKTAALYEFIRSERCSQLFARIDGHAE